LVVNRSGRTIHVAVVNDGDTIDCSCRIGPGDSLRLGYYPLGLLSFVLVRDSARATGKFNAVLTGVDSVSGLAVFRVTAASLVPPLPTIRRAPARAQPPENRDPLRAFLPVH
jgi:hypothetical protein